MKCAVSVCGGRSAAIGYASKVIRPGGGMMEGMPFREGEGGLRCPRQIRCDAHAAAETWFWIPAGHATVAASVQPGPQSPLEHPVSSLRCSICRPENGNLLPIREPVNKVTKSMMLWIHQGNPTVSVDKLGGKK
ncbi:hypothetical protein VTK26DRAFT_6512 [Humicola hyalothermophila]